MAHEVETKVLDVSPESIAAVLSKLGAKSIQDTRLIVDWLGTPGVKEGEHPWYLRVRTSSDGKTEVTWKGQSDKLGAARKHEEINVDVGDHQSTVALFEKIGLATYAHQEKDRKSWELKGWRFDLDSYPGMPPYLEIEGDSEEHIQKALQLLNLQDHQASSEGERVLIQTEYGLNWYDMRFV